LFIHRIYILLFLELFFVDFVGILFRLFCSQKMLVQSLAVVAADVFNVFFGKCLGIGQYLLQKSSFVDQQQGYDILFL